MPKLAEIQRMFAQAVLDEREQDCAPWIRVAGVPPAERFKIYRNNVLGNLTDTLRNFYAAIERLVGEGFFLTLAEAYIRAHPSVSGNLNEFGKAFPDFLSGFPPAQALPYLADVARLEWACHEVFLAPDHAPLDLNALAQVSPEDYGRICFHCHPALRLCRSEYPLFRIWQLCQDADADQAPAISLDDPGEQILIRRNGAALVIEPLNWGEYRFLDLLLQGVDFQLICVEAEFAAASIDIAAVLQKQVVNGAIVSFTFQT